MAARAKTKTTGKKSGPVKKAVKKTSRTSARNTKASDIVAELTAADGKALYACRAEESNGRLYDEAPSKTRTDFHRDRDRIIHSTAFRRLKFKTQVFVYHEGDHYRSRLTHSVEVAQVARSLARNLKLDEDLAEACGLAHDVGHTPFAHVGEDALKECMKPYGGFDHNDQTLRVVTMLEKKYPSFDGLNLTWETLEGLVKHNGPVIRKNKKQKLEITLSWLQKQMDMKLDTYASLEAQAAAIADDIAYNSHDLDDGLAAGVFTLKDLEELPWLGSIIHRKRKEYPGIEERRLIPELVREVMGLYVLDVLAESKRRLADLKPQSPDDIRYAGKTIITPSAEMQAADKEMRKFLWENFYRSYRVSRVRNSVFKVVQDLFTVCMEQPRCLPPEWYNQWENVPKGWKSEMWKARTIADYIASMTDRFALLEHRELFDAYHQVIR